MNIVFLDIDGVLQPYESEYRFYTDKELITRLSELYGVDYSIYNFWDVASVYYDWDDQAVSRLKYVLDTTKSKIIVASNWRNKKYPNKMADLLKIRSLDKYYLRDNVILGDSNIAEIRHLEIEKSLEDKNIVNFVVLDDKKEMGVFYPNNSVITHNIMSISDMNKCIKILKRK